ncbi:MAG: DHA2 family efflux MFS transporter permease subunit [Micromonosporaceae bacterium]|nr:DHA2 family efflux MFS transporter permease subunit [Micromonosporaceae bacterium]
MLVVSLLVVVLDNTVLNVALKAIADPVHGLGATQSELEWSINSYTLVFAGLLFTSGVLGDRHGRRAALLLGMVLFGLASLASAYAQTPAQLIGARALMGIGGAAILPATLSIISNVFHPTERARAIGVWAGAVGLGVAIGPVVGGALLERFWWGSVFLINVPILLAGLIAVLVLVPESRDPSPGRIDAIGVALSIVGLVSLVYGVIEGGETGDWGRPDVWGPIAAGVGVIAAFIWYERRAAHPALDVTLFRDPRFSAAVAMIGLVFFGAMGTFFFGSFYLQLVRGFTPLQAGLLMLPFAAAQLIFAPLSSSLVKRYGPKAVSVTALLVTAVATGGFTIVAVDTPVWLLGTFFFLQGVGMASVIPSATESVMSTLPREKAGVGSAVNNTIRQVGGALGVAVLGSLLSAVYREQITPHVSGLPHSAQEVAKESVAGTYGVADRLGPASASLLDSADDAFVTAMHWAAGGSVAVMLVGALVALKWLPGLPAGTPAATPAAASRVGEPELVEAG